METFDAIIIGSGQAGNPLAKRLSKEGWRVALVECAAVGGTCINYGCTPTKSLVGSARKIFHAKHAAEHGLTIVEKALDYQVIVQRKNRIVANFREPLERALMQDPNITVLKGKGSFSNHKELRVQLNKLIPYCVFTDPDLGRIGLTETAAREKSLDFTVAKMKTSSIARAVETGETSGFVKAIIDNNTKAILGAAVICPGGGELMSLLQIAMAGGLTYEQLRDTMFAHPTYAESINNLFSATHLQREIP